MDAVRVYFVDVGQGDCSLIVLPDHSAVLIDCRDEFAAEQLMRDEQISYLRAIVVTHLDEDHIAGLIPLLEHWTEGLSVLERIDSLWIDADRVRSRLSHAGHEVLSLALSLAAEHGVSLRAPSREELPKTICAQNDGPGWSVQLLLPFHDQRLAHHLEFGAEGNPVSAVVRVSNGAHHVLIGGDAPLGSFERLHASDPAILPASVVRTPHHGGDIRQPTSTWRDFHELYDRAQAWLAVHSVGSHNRYGHPLREHVQATRRAGACHVMCTELTAQCHADLERIRDAPPPSLTVAYPDHQKLARGARGLRDRGVACAGTVLVDLTAEGCEVHPSPEEHAEFVEALDRPVCRSTTSP